MYVKTSSPIVRQEIYTEIEEFLKVLQFLKFSRISKTFLRIFTEFLKIFKYYNFTIEAFVHSFHWNNFFFFLTLRISNWYFQTSPSPPYFFYVFAEKRKNMYCSMAIHYYLTTICNTNSFQFRFLVFSCGLSCVECFGNEISEGEWCDVSTCRHMRLTSTSPS